MALLLNFLIPTQTHSYIGNSAIWECKGVVAIDYTRHIWRPTIHGGFYVAFLSLLRCVAQLPLKGREPCVKHADKHFMVGLSPQKRGWGERIPPWPCLSPPAGAQTFLPPPLELSTGSLHPAKNREWAWKKYLHAQRVRKVYSWGTE